MVIEPLHKTPPLPTPQRATGVRWLVLAILAIVPLLPSDFVGHAHWDGVRWIPFQDFTLSRRMLIDVVGNVLWFMAFGYLLHHQLYKDSPSLWTITVITTIAGSLSLSIEFFQVFCHNRIPAMTDVLCNTLGASLGGWVVGTHQATRAIQRQFDSWLAKLKG